MHHLRQTFLASYLVRAGSLLAGAGLAALCLLLLGVTGCSRGQTEEDDPLFSRVIDEGPPPLGEGIMGYNEPLQFVKGIGVRATGSGKLIAISVHNKTAGEVVVGPAQFRLLLPDRSQYGFEEGRDDLRGFPVRPLAPSESQVFWVSLAGAGDIPNIGEVIGLPLVYQYPPLGVLIRVPVEPPMKKPMGEED